MQLITNQFSAEFGGHSAGVASMITKSGTNELNGSAFVMIRPGDLDAAPPLAPVKARRRTTSSSSAARSAARSSGTSVFYFGSYERRRERSQVVVTSPEAFGLVVPTPADEHQGHVKVDLRFSAKNSLGVRYNMVRWKKDNESGGLHLPGTGFIWDNNVDTVHGTFTVGRLGSVPQRSARPVLALHRPARREMRLRVDSARRLLDHAAATTSARGACCPRRPTTSRHDVAVDGQPHDEDRRVVHL